MNKQDEKYAYEQKLLMNKNFLYIFVRDSLQSMILQVWSSYFEVVDTVENKFSPF